MRVGLAPQVYIITDRAAQSARSAAESVGPALAALAPTRLRVAVQLRDRERPVQELLHEARSLRELTSHHGASLFINDRLDVALAVGADGVHLPVAGLPIAHARLVARDLAIGASTHDLDQVRRAHAEGADFAVFGPVFDTPSKRGLLAPRGLEALEDAAHLGIPVLALGGVDERTAPACLSAGAAGIAAIRLFSPLESLDSNFVVRLTNLFRAERPVC